jgi:hypothetical protein
MMRLITNPSLAMGICIPLVLAVAQEPGERQPQLGSRGVPLITVDGLRSRDLNSDGKLEPYEDWRLPAQQRANDLADRMSLEEKAGLMMHASAPAEGSAASRDKIEPGSRGLRSMFPFVSKHDFSRVAHELKEKGLF